MARTRQPQGPASVNWSHPSTRSLIAAAYPVGAGLWLANKGTFHSAQSVSLNTGVTTHGRTVYGPNESVTNFIPLASDTFAAPITMLAAILPVGGGNAACTICSFGSGSSNGRIALQYGAVDLGNQYLRLVSSATAVLATDTFPAFSGANGVGSPEIVAATYAGTSAGYSFWHNGSKSSSGTTASTSALFDGFGALDSSTYPSYQGYTRIAGIFCWSRILSDDELQSLTTKPWPLFAPQRRLWIQLGAAAGGSSTYPYTGSGTLVYAGTPAYRRLIATINSGGVSFTGTPSYNKSTLPVVSGGYTHSGQAIYNRLFSPLATGGLTLTGNGVLNVIRAALAAGGFIFAGSAPFVPALGGSVTYSPSVGGTLTFSNTAEFSILRSVLASGGLVYSGSAGLAILKAIVAAGGLTFSGAASVSGPSSGTGTLDQTTIDAIATAVWQRIIESGLSAEQLIRLLVSHAAGSATGLENGSPVFKSLDGSKNRITGTYSAGTRNVTGRDAT